MALSQKHRSSLYRSLAPMVGEEEAEALLSEFPSTDLDTPATKEFVRAELAAEVGSVRTDLAALEARINDRFRELTVWMAGALVSGMGVAAAIAALL